MEKKIRVTISKKIDDILNDDVKSFKITKNYLINYIFEHLKDEQIEDYPETHDKKEVIQFNLNKKNKETYYEFLHEKQIQVEADFIRKLIQRYALYSKHNRELFVFKENVNRIKYAIENKQVMKIKFRDKRETTVLGFHLGSSKLELTNYLFCYDYEEKKYKNYKFTNINIIYITKEKREWMDVEFIQNVIKNFDPFLSVGKTITARLSENGKLLLESIIVNRPETLEVNDDIYTFKCSEQQAKRYFAYFLDEIEILEPASLREWFILKFTQALANYNSSK